MRRNSSHTETAPPPSSEAANRLPITRARFAPCRDLYASDAVRDAVAAVERRDPQTLEPPLAAVVDTAAVDSLFSNGSADAHLSFRYADYTIQVHGDGWVRVW